MSRGKQGKALCGDERGQPYCCCSRLVKSDIECGGQELRWGAQQSRVGSDAQGERTAGEVHVWPPDSALSSLCLHSPSLLASLQHTQVI